MGEYTFINCTDRNKSLINSYLIGYITTSREILTRLLGPPLPRKNVDEKKTISEWNLSVNNYGEYVGAISIYDYKEERVYGYDEELEFHIGGKSETFVIAFLDMYIKELQRNIEKSLSEKTEKLTCTSK